MSLFIRAATATDAAAIGQLAAKFAQYLRDLGDTTDFKLTAEAVIRDGFGNAPAFSGVVAENQGVVLGYLLYHFGYDSDRAARNLHIADLYVADTARRRGIGRALMFEVARIARLAGAEELIWSVYRQNKLATEFCKQLGAKRSTDVHFMKLEVERL